MLKALVYWQIVIGLTVCSRTLMAQAGNNNISSRSQLSLDQSPTTSSTNNATVEWQCVNKKLTNKCLVYHNDQWFTFTPPVKGKYYINVSARDCRDNRGIQAIVIEGNPCEISTYKILKCISQIRFQDSFIEIDSMEANVSYLINIDGFLGDYCEFSIQFSSNPHGISVDGHALKKLELSARSQEGIEILSWKLPLNLKDSIESFSVYRKADHQRLSTLRGSVALGINAKGEYQSDYTYIDTLQGSRPYSYQIVGNMNDNRQVVLDELFVNERTTNRNGLFRISFNLDYKNKSKLQIVLVDAIRDVVLRQETLAFSEVLDKSQSFYVEGDVRRGISNFKVVIVDLKTRRKAEMLFFVDKEGKVITR